MPYELVIPVALGTSRTGLTLSAKLVDAISQARADTPGSSIEHGAGAYSFVATAIPDAFQGPIEFYARATASPADTPVFAAATAINPDTTALSELVELSPDGAASVVSVLRGNDYTADRAITLTNQAWPDLTGAVVTWQGKLGFDVRTLPLTVAAPRLVTLSLTADVTAGLQPGVYTGELQAALASGQTVTIQQLSLDATYGTPT